MMILSMFEECFSRTTLAMTGAAVLTLFYFLVKRPRNFPPGPAGLPLVGYLPFLGKNASETLHKMKSKYGSVLSVQMGRENWVILNDYNAINEAFVKQGDKFSGRPNNFMLKVWTNGYGLFNLEYGSDFAAAKKFLMRSLRGYDVDKKAIEDSIVEECSLLMDSLTTENSNRKSFTETIPLAISNIMYRVAFASRLPYDDKRLNTMVDTIAEIFTGTPSSKMFGLFMIAPALRHLPPFKKGLQDIIRLRNILLDRWSDIIEDHKQSYDENNIRDLIDAFIKEMNSKNGKSSVFCISQLPQFLRDLLEAGTGTTSSTMMWCLLCLASFPKYQKKIFDEINTVLGDEGTPRMKHRHEMHYTCALIHELMRHRTLVPLGVPHKTSEEVTLNGYTIPKNTTVSPNIWAVHFDPDLFEDPTAFRPERFLDKDGKFVESKHVIPFSAGPRQCLGKQLAKMEVFIFLTNIVQKLEVLPIPSKPLPSFFDGASYSMLGYDPLPFEVTFKRR